MIDILIIVWLHWVADFVFQSDKIALNKSENVLFLGMHSAIYALPFLLLFGIEYCLFNFSAHFIIDFISSRITKYYWLKENRHAFFVTIGLDQAIHLTILIVSLGWLVA